MRAKRLTWKGETTHQEGQIDPGRIGSKGETTRGEWVKGAKRPDARPEATRIFVGLVKVALYTIQCASKICLWASG